MVTTSPNENMTKSLFEPPADSFGAASNAITSSSKDNVIHVGIGGDATKLISPTIATPVQVGEPAQPPASIAIESSAASVTPLLETSLNSTPTGIQGSPAHHDNSMQISTLDGPNVSSPSMPSSSLKAADPSHPGPSIPGEGSGLCLSPDERHEDNTEATSTTASTCEMNITGLFDTPMSDMHIEDGHTSGDNGVSGPAIDPLSQGLSSQQPSDGDVEMREGEFELDFSMHEDAQIQFGKQLYKTICLCLIIH